MKLVIFDCDGTIVDSQHAIFASMARAFEGAGFTAPSREDVLRIVGLSLTEAIARLLPQSDRQRAHDLAEAYKSSFREIRLSAQHDEPLYPGARDAIGNLSARDDVVLGIATGKSRRGVDALFERESLGPHFVTIQTADDHPSKPHPSMIERAMAETGADAANTAMIGDTTFDIEMARAARVHGIGVSWGYHRPDELHVSGAAVVASDYAHLTQTLNDILSLQEPVT